VKPSGLLPERAGWDLNPTNQPTNPMLLPNNCGFSHRTLLRLMPLSTLTNEEDLQKSTDIFHTLAMIRYHDFLSKLYGSQLFPAMLFADEGIYHSLKLRGYTIVESRARFAYKFFRASSEYQNVE